MRALSNYCSLKVIVLSLLVCGGVSKSQSSFSSSKEQNQLWRLDNFNKELFWEEPAEGINSFIIYLLIHPFNYYHHLNHTHFRIGLYEVDVGLRQA